MIEYYKSNSGSVYYIRKAYSLVGFKRGSGENMGVYDSMAVAVREARKLMCLNDQIKCIMVREEEVWCDTPEEAEALSEFDTLKNSSASGPIVQLDQAWAHNIAEI